MAKIILKWRYLKPGTKAHGKNMVKYIAKREGVDKIDDTWKVEQVSQAQQKMIDDLLQEFPECKDSYEYQDYLRQPNKGNASEFITRTIEENLDRIDKRENYVQYIAKRPRVEKMGTHGLFTDENVPVHLNQVAEEVASHQGVLMTQILSLRREDAARLGYEKGEAWRTLIRNHTKDIEDIQIELKTATDNEYDIRSKLFFQSIKIAVGANRDRIIHPCLQGRACCNKVLFFFFVFGIHFA